MNPTAGGFDDGMDGDPGSGDEASVCGSTCWRPATHSPPTTAPLAADSVHAGFPSPAEDHAESSLDLTRRLIRRPSATFFVRAEGDSMEPLIRTGDLLVVDRSRTANDGDVVIAVVDGDFTVKRFVRGVAGHVTLVPVNPVFQPIVIGAGCEIDTWGVVTAVVRELVKSG